MAALLFVLIYGTWQVLWVVISSTQTSSHEDLEHNGKCVSLCGIPGVYISSPCFLPLVWLYHLLCLPVHNLLQGNNFPFIKERDFLPSPLVFLCGWENIWPCCREVVLEKCMWQELYILWTSQNVCSIEIQTMRLSGWSEMRAGSDSRERIKDKCKWQLSPSLYVKWEMCVPKCHVYERADPNQGELLKLHQLLWHSFLKIWQRLGLLYLKSIWLSSCYLGKKQQNLTMELP